jgi:titin
VDRTVALDPGELSLTSSSPGLSPPSALTAVAVSATHIDITWQDNATRETGVELWRSTTGTGGTFELLIVLGSDATSYGHDGLTELKQYCYKARVLRRTGGKTTYSTFSDAACATTPAAPPPPPVPNAPSGVVVVPRNNLITISWVDNSDNEDWFNIEHSPTGSDPWTLIPISLGSGYTSYTQSNVPLEQLRCYRVFARNGYGWSAPSNVDCTTPPAIPTGVTAVAADGPRVNVTWSDNSSAEDGYQVFRAWGGASFTLIADVPANTSSYTDLDVTTDQTYSYAVRATKDGGFTGLSSYATVTIGTLKLPAKPSFAGAPEGYYLGTMWIVWYNGPGMADSYKLERCDTETCTEADFRVIATVAATTEFIMSRQDGVADWTIYTYRLRATNSVGDSEPSDPAQGRSCIDGVDWESPCFPPLPAIGSSERRTLPLTARSRVAPRLSPTRARP